MKEIFDNNLIEPDILQGPVYFSEDLKYRIDCCVSLSNTVDPYFRIYRGDNTVIGLFDDDTKLCRISMLNPIYIDGVGSDMILSFEEINNLINILNSPSKYEDNVSVWQNLINLYNYESDGQGPKPLPTDLPMPDYRKLIINSSVE